MTLLLLQENVDDLTLLDDADLREMGVKLGDRKKILGKFHSALVSVLESVDT